jgi:DNA-binding transcriptional LysR family regulator
MDQSTIGRIIPNLWFVIRDGRTAMDRLQGMEVFVAVVECGSLTAAADRLGLSAQMVGKHLKALEARLGVAVLSRSTRRQSLTEPGRHYLEHCRLILEQLRLAESGVDVLKATPRGRLRISAPVSFGTQCLAPALVEYLARYPSGGGARTQRSARGPDRGRLRRGAAHRSIARFGLVARALAPTW